MRKYGGTNEVDDLLENATQPPRRTGIPFPCHLLVAPSASGVSGMAVAAGHAESNRAIQSDSHGGQRTTFAPVTTTGIRSQGFRGLNSDHKGESHALSDMSLCNGEHQQPSH